LRKLQWTSYKPASKNHLEAWYKLVHSLSKKVKKSSLPLNFTFRSSGSSNGYSSSAACACASSSGSSILTCCYWI
jgi:hypothetical protein